MVLRQKSLHFSFRLITPNDDNEPPPLLRTDQRFCRFIFRFHVIYLFFFQMQIKMRFGFVTIYFLLLRGCHKSEVCLWLGFEFEAFRYRKKIDIAHDFCCSY